MMHTTSALYAELVKNLQEVELQITHIKNDIKNQYPDDARGKINVWYWMRNTDGSYVMSQMLAAKAQILSGMAALKAADVASKAPRR